MNLLNKNDQEKLAQEVAAWISVYLKQHPKAA